MVGSSSLFFFFWLQSWQTESLCSSFDNLHTGQAFICSFAFFAQFPAIGLVALAIVGILCEELQHDLCCLHHKFQFFLCCAVWLCCPSDHTVSRTGGYLTPPPTTSLSWIKKYAAWCIYVHFIMSRTQDIVLCITASETTSIACTLAFYKI